METSGILTLLGTATSLCAVLFGYLSFLRSRKQDNEREGLTSGTLGAEIRHLDASIADIRHRLDKLEERSLETYSRQVTTETCCQQFRKQLDQPSGARD